MLYYLRNRRKTIKTLRRRAKLTARELAMLLKQDTAFVLRMDDKRLSALEPSLRHRLIRVLRRH